MDDEVERRLRALKGDSEPGVAEEPARSALSGEVVGPDDAGGPWRGARSIGEGDRRGKAGRDGAARPASGRVDGRPSGPAVRAVSWSISEARAGRLGLWFGLGLLAFGTYLVLVAFVPELRIAGSIALLLLGVWALAWRALRRAGAWALYVGAVLAGYGAGGTVASLVAGGRGGWGSLGVGLAFLAIGGWRAVRGGGIGWQVWIGAVLSVWGAWGALGSVVPGFPTAGDLAVPVLLVLAGALVVRRGIR